MPSAFGVDELYKLAKVNENGSKSKLDLKTTKMELLNNTFLKLLFLNSILYSLYTLLQTRKPLGRVRVLHPNMQVYKFIYLFCETWILK